MRGSNVGANYFSTCAMCVHEHIWTCVHFHITVSNGSGGRGSEYQHAHRLQALFNYSPGRRRESCIKAASRPRVFSPPSVQLMTALFFSFLHCPYSPLPSENWDRGILAVKRKPSDGRGMNIPND